MAAQTPDEGLVWAIVDWLRAHPAVWPYVLLFLTWGRKIYDAINRYTVRNRQEQRADDETATEMMQVAMKELKGLFDMQKKRAEEAERLRSESDAKNEKERRGLQQKIADLEARLAEQRDTMQSQIEALEREVADLKEALPKERDG